MINNKTAQLGCCMLTCLPNGSLLPFASTTPPYTDCRSAWQSQGPLMTVLEQANLDARHKDRTGPSA